MKTQSLRLIAAMWTLLLLVACGGGGSVTRDDETTTSDPDITISLNVVNQSDETDRDLSLSNPLTVIATVTTTNGQPVSDTLVTFTVAQENLLVFGNDTGTARTNSEGVASIGITVGSLSGDGQIVATIDSGESATTTFSSAGSGTTSTQPATLDLYASSIQLASSGSDEIELIALLKDAQSVLMEGVDVSFSASSSAEVELQLVQPTTEADGTARAILSTQNNATNRTVTITAQSGVLTQTVDIEIFGTEVTINGTNSVILNDSVEFTLRVQDSDGVAIPNQAIEVSAANGVLSAASVTTQANGQATVTYTGSVSGIDTITATALNDEATFSVTVQQDEFAFNEDYSDEIALNTPVDIAVTWNKEGAPYVGGDVTFTASRGVISSGSTTTTDVNGVATFTISSNNAGLSSITATGTDANGDEVSARIQLEFVATAPAYIQADATPDLIGPDGQTSTITALVRDADDNLVKGAVVTFNVDDSSTGSISPSQATTDSNGIASTVFTSGSVTSQNAVVITAQILNDAAVSDQVNLTVGNRAFDVSIGTGNVVSKPDDSTYLKEFAVFVTDSVGQPVAGVDLTASVTPTKFTNSGVYHKGFWVWDETVWVVGYLNADDEIVYGYTATCPNEDIDGDGVLDLGEDITNQDGMLDASDDSDGDGAIEYGEDRNDDGFLTPGIVGAISFKDGNSATDENGQATLELRYPRAYGVFYEAQITVFAQSTGSEAKASMNFTYSVAGDDLDDEAEVPPSSPFGTNTSCFDIH